MADWRATGLMAFTLAACSGGAGSDDGTPSDGTEAPAPAELGEGPHRALIVAQAWFEMEGKTPVPQPAKLVILRTDGITWESEELVDAGSNVYHKAIPWRDGILAIGGTGARLVHWTHAGDGWTATELYAQSWGGDFDRLRDLELGDVDGDGADEIVLATHDQGVVVVGDESGGTWTFTETPKQADTFVHEIEIGDVDRDGKLEFYATPSGRNKASLESQPGAVVRYDHDPATGTYTVSAVAEWDESHAKEILVTDLGGDHDALFAVREGHTKKVGGEVKVIDPVRIVRLTPGDDGWVQTTVATLDDQLCRFLLAADLDGDGTVELVAAGMRSGVWFLEPRDDGTFEKTLIDAKSSGFEHASHVADLDGDGTPELYVAADDQDALRRYTWNGTGFDRAEVVEIPKYHITWNIQDGTL